VSRAANSLNNFNFTFTQANIFQQIENYVSGDRLFLNVQFGTQFAAPGGIELGDARGMDMNLLGSDWQSEPQVVDHEFGHILGLGHNDIPNTLMYPYLSNSTPQTILPAERNNLLKAYGSH